MFVCDRIRVLQHSLSSHNSSETHLASLHKVVPHSHFEPNASKSSRIVHNNSTFWHVGKNFVVVSRLMSTKCNVLARKNDFFCFFLKEAVSCSVN